MAIDFTAKLGPLPVYGWGIIGGGVIAVAAYMLNRNSSAVSGGAVVVPADGYQTTGIKMSSEETPEVQQYDTNTAWLARAARQISSSLAKSYTDVYNALWKFVRGQALTTEEKGIVDTAVSQIGAPPEGTEGISETKSDRVVKYYRRSKQTKRLYVIYTNGEYREITQDEWVKAGRPPIPDTDSKNLQKYKRVV